MAITWTKEWMASDDGTIVSGLDLKNIQDDITSGSSGDATSIWSIPIVQPTASEDGEVLFYDHGAGAFDFVASSAVVVPAGIIVMWSGAVSAVPSGWVICDGNNSTPNLTDRFVIHADADSGGTNDVGDTGGSQTMAHTHTIPNNAQQTDVGWDGDGVGSKYYTTITHNHGGTSGAASASDNRPAFYALAYIMKS